MPADVMSSESAAAETTKSGSNVRISAIVAIAAVAALAAWLIVDHLNSGSSSSKTITTNASATSVSASGLKTIADALGQPIYWAGAQSGQTYELTQSPDGRIYVRYLPNGVAVGTRTPFLTIATYPVTDAYAATQTASSQSGTVKMNVGPNAIAFYDSSRPTNVYQAFKGSNFQIEVYSPSAKQAQGIVSGGKLVDAGGRSTSPASSPVPRGGATAVTPAVLESTSSRLGLPIYWAGAQSGVTYELTQTPNGRIYVRYLPAGVKIGVDHPYMTVATYPLKNAFSQTSTAAGAEGAVKVPVENGVAFYTTAHPESVYVAFKGSDQQIEVFDPSANHAAELVAAGKVKPVS